MKKVYTFFIVFIFSYCVLFAQDPLPGNDPVFTDTKIPRIDILINPDSLAYILAAGNEESDHEFPATLIFQHTALRDTIDSIGFRLKGNSSRYGIKKSFKVSFNTFKPGKKYFGLEKMNLNAETNDPTLVRSKLIWDIFRSVGVPAPRANHVELYINNEYRGLYLNVEHIDEEFARLRFGTANGNLYKCLYPADLKYLGDNPDVYKLVVNGRQPYQLKTNNESYDYSDLSSLIKLLNNTPLAELPDELEKIFNVNSFLKFLAVESMTGHWDSYSYLKNNYYLYFNTLTGRFEFIPYDLDNTFGTDWLGVDWANRGIYNMANEPNSVPLTQRILEVEKYRNRMSYYIKYLLTNVMDTISWYGYIDEIEDRIKDYAEDDPYRVLDYNWTVQDFHDSYTQAYVGGQNHVPWGLKPFITQRISVAGDQLLLQDIAPVVSGVTYNQPPLNQALDISAVAYDEESDPELTVKYKLNGGSEQHAVMIANGVTGGYPAYAVNFSVEIPPLEVADTVDFYIEAVDGTGLVTREPSIGFYRSAISNFSVPLLRINEFMADNTSRGADENGDYEDWIEIVNAGSLPVWLGDKFLTDNLSERNKWRMPDITLDAGEFALFWCDAAPPEGPMHTSFRLSKNGEEIGIFDSQANGYAPIDTLKYRYQQEDVSYGRKTDGNRLYRYFLAVTPGHSNTLLPTGNPEILQAPLLDLTVFPNPFSENLNIIYGETNKSRLVITDIMGHRIYSTELESSSDSNRLTIDESVFGSPGIYFLYITSQDETKQEFRQLVQKIIKIE